MTTMPGGLDQTIILNSFQIQMSRGEWGWWSGREPQFFPKEKKEVGTSAPRAACPPATNSHYTNTLLPILEPFITSFPESPLAAARPQEEDGKALQTLGCDSSSPRPLVPLSEASGGSTAP